MADLRHRGARGDRRANDADAIDPRENGAVDVHVYDSAGARRFRVFVPVVHDRTMQPGPDATCEARADRVALVTRAIVAPRPRPGAAACCVTPRWRGAAP